MGPQQQTTIKPTDQIVKTISKKTIQGRSPSTPSSPKAPCQANSPKTPRARRNFFYTRITVAEDERTSMAKTDTKNTRRVTINLAHQTNIKPKPNLLQRGCNVTYSIGTSLQQGLLKTSRDKHRVQFAMANSETKFDSADNAAMITYDSGADGHYISEEDRKRAGLPNLRTSQKKTVA